MPSQTVLNAIEALPVTSESPPPGIYADWPSLVRSSLRAWAAALERDVARAAAGIEAATEPADDEQVAALEESFWRLHSATEKIDAIAAIAFGSQPIQVEGGSKRLRFDPSYRENGIRLRDLGTPAALRLRELRAKLEGERAILRRHQVAHSLAPLVMLPELATFITVLHRHGSILVGGYHVGVLGPERWDEGLDYLSGETLFARRVVEARRAHNVLVETLGALADALRADARIEIPQHVYKDVESGKLTLERPPAPAAGPPIYVVELVPKENPSQTRQMHSQFKLQVGLVLTIDDQVVRVVEIKESEGDRIDQIAVYLRVSESQG